MFLNFMIIQISVLDSFWSILILVSFWLGGLPKSPPKKIQEPKNMKSDPSDPLQHPAMYLGGPFSPPPIPKRWSDSPYLKGSIPESLIP